MAGAVATQIPGYTVGTWKIDQAHSDVSFTVRHLMVSKVRGNFRSFEGTLVTAEDPQNSSVTATIQLDSIDTNQEQRNAHIRSADFFEVEKYPVMTYRSTGVRPDGHDWIVDGELTLKGVTKQVPLKLELNGFGPDAYGGTRAGFTAKAEINRSDFGVSWNANLDGGGVVISEKVQILLEIEAVLDKDAE
ncbi:MAG TPA: YceI family protein [Actinocrinis sp.]|jgi:polyisoprenoid-binding protein YceI|uniref:YceI family protein n=1 Tax=Actinocrinis sp. TaxID=1920516 RepID=UPI002DDD7471|nr:YceI family protein [Actinocrinis sp.]HEV3170916.1 YceI family protein [Actinocrinis sp.]